MVVVLYGVHKLDHRTVLPICKIHKSSLEILQKYVLKPKRNSLQGVESEGPEALESGFTTLGYLCKMSCYFPTLPFKQMMDLHNKGDRCAHWECLQVKQIVRAREQTERTCREVCRHLLLDWHQCRLDLYSRFCSANGEEQTILHKVKDTEMEIILAIWRCRRGVDSYQTHCLNEWGFSLKKKKFVNAEVVCHCWKFLFHVYTYGGINWQWFYLTTCLLSSVRSLVIYGLFFAENWAQWEILGVSKVPGQMCD